MIQIQLTLQNQLGLHTRAAAKLVAIAKRFQSRIELAFEGQLVDCKSIMRLITLGAQQHHPLDFFIQGDDEEAASLAITALINHKFGEPS